MLPGIDATAFLHALPTLDMRNLVATEIVEFLPKFDDDNRTRSFIIHLDSLIIFHFFNFIFFSERLVVNLIETIYATKSFQRLTSRNIEDRRCLPIDELVDETRRRASH